MTERDARTRAGLEAITRVATGQAGLRLLVLFGSRARGEATARSDWDLGYLADPTLDREGWLGHLVAALGTEAIDLVDLARASGLVRYRAARDAVVVFEAGDGTFASFWFDAVSYWCDMGPIIRAGYDDVLAEIAR
jgi:predicted nucleotidyltransferase